MILRKGSRFAEWSRTRRSICRSDSSHNIRRRGPGIIHLTADRISCSVGHSLLLKARPSDGRLIRLGHFRQSATCEKSSGNRPIPSHS